MRIVPYRQVTRIGPGGVDGSSRMTSFVKTWMVRLLLLVVFSGLGLGGWMAYNWISPEKVRASVEQHLQAKVADNVHVRVGSACIRMFGGISVNDIEFTHTGESTPFLHVDSAVVSHDKERLNHGELVIRKVEVEGLTLRLEKDAEGKWNVSDYFKPGSSDQPIPSVQFKNATVIVTDRSPNGLPTLTLRKANLQLSNEPATVLKLDGQAELSPGEMDTGTRIPMTFAFRMNRQTQQITTKIELTELATSPELFALVTQCCPEAGEYAKRYSGKLKLKADVSVKPENVPPISYDVRLELAGGRIIDANLPWSIEQLNGAIRYHDGKLSVEKLTGKLGTATAELSFETRVDPADRLQSSPISAQPGPRMKAPVFAHHLKPLAERCLTCDDDFMQTLEDKIDKLDFSITGLALNDELFKRLPAKAARIRTMFSPEGSVDFGFKFVRTENSWKREVEMKPNVLKATYEKFKYPMDNLAGSLKKITASDGTDEFRVNMTATAGGRRIEIAGKVAGEGPDPHIAMRIAGTDIPIDDKLFNALPAKYAESLSKLRAKARGDFVVDIRQHFQVNRCENTFRVRVYNGDVNYKHFPYSFAQLRGNILVQVSASDPARPLRPGLPIAAEIDTDRVELRNFEAAHDGGRMWLSGESESVAGTHDRKLTLRMQGESWPIDAQFHSAIKELKLENAVKYLAVRGDITFGAELEIWDRQVNKPKVQPVISSVIPVSFSAKQDPPVADAVALLPAEPPFNPITDLRLAVNFKGPSITPEFLPLDMHQLAGVVRFHGGRVELSRFSAKHGTSQLKMDAADVRIADTGDIWANIGGIGINPFVPSESFLKAMPAKIQSALKEINIRGPAELDVKHLVISIPTKKAVPVAMKNDYTPKVTVRAQAPDPQDRWKPLVSQPEPTITVKPVEPKPVEPSIIVASSEASVPVVDPKKDNGTTKPFTPVPMGNHQELPPELRITPVIPVITPKPVVVQAAGIEPKKEKEKPSRFSFTMPWSKKETPPPTPIPSEPVIVDDESPTIYWNAILKLNGGSLQAGVLMEDVHGSIASEGIYESTHLGAVIGNAYIERGTVAKQPITAGKVSYRVRPQQPDPLKPGAYLPPIMEFPDLTASLFQGSISGQARVVLADPIRYRVYASANGVKLDEFAKHYKLGSGADLRGLAQGSILIENVADPKTGALITTGNGQIDVPQGRMYNLPVLLELVKVLKGQTPDGCAFDEAHATFEIKGDRLKVTQLDLLGSAVSLGGSGELDMTGEYVKFEFFTIWSQTLKRWLTTPLGDVTSMLSGSLFKIELTRENGKLTPKTHMLPAITDPVKNVAERLRGRFQKPAETAKPTPKETTVTRSYENRQ